MRTTFHCTQREISMQSREKTFNFIETGNRSKSGLRHKGQANIEGHVTLNLTNYIIINFSNSDKQIYSATNISSFKI